MKKEARCVFNNMILCDSADNCPRCGWNPEVMAQRKQKIEDEGAYALSGTRHHGEEPARYTFMGPNGYQFIPADESVLAERLAAYERTGLTPAQVNALLRGSGLT